MAKLSSSIDKGIQWFALLAGLGLLWLGLDDAITSYSLGHLQFTHEQAVFSGRIAGALIGAHILVGLGLVWSSLRKLEGR